MNDKMSQAIAAARSGQSQKAQILLAQILQNDQANVNAWFLLSHLIDVPEKKISFLKKVLALDPNHTKAKQTLIALEASVVEPIAANDPGTSNANAIETAHQLDETPPETAVPAPVISPTEDLTSQADSSSLPSWLTEEDEAVFQPEELAAEALPDFNDGVASEDLPDWLTKTNIDDWTAAKPWEQAEEDLDLLFEDDEPEEQDLPETPATEPIKSAVDVAREQQDETPPAPTREKPIKQTSDRTLNITLTILIIIAFLVLAGLIYIVISNP